MHHLGDRLLLVCLFALLLRIELPRPRLIVADERDRGELEAALTRIDGPEVAFVPDDDLFEAAPEAPVELAKADPCLITFTSGTAGEPKAVVHAQRYLL